MIQHEIKVTRNKKTPRKLFSHEEDKKLIELYEKYKDNWKEISKEMKNRSVRQCKERYYHYLSPNIKKNEWNQEEDILLIKLNQKFGNKWKYFEFFFPGRTEIDIRNRFNVIYRLLSKNNIILPTQINSNIL